MNETTNIPQIDLDSRPTYRETGKILAICGFDYVEFGKTINVTSSFVSKMITQHPLERLTLNRVDMLKKLVKEENYYKALTEIRREAQKK